MRVATRYGRLTLTVPTKRGDGQPTLTATWPLTHPVDCLLRSKAFNNTGQDGLDETWDWFGGLGLFGEGVVSIEADLPKAKEKFKQEISGWRRSGVPAVFLTAAQEASVGRLVPDLALHLARVTFGSRGKADEIDDFLALTAWCLERAMRDRGFQVLECALCGDAFLSSGRARYCQRFAPVGPFQTAREQIYERDPIEAARARITGLWANGYPTCQDVGKVRDYRTRKRAARRGERDV
jgi:hypothetical protein